METVLAPTEKTLGRIAAGALSGSALLVFGFFFTVFAAISHMWQAVVVAAVLALYFAQVHYLSTIGRHPAKRRLLTWQFSLAAHALVFVVAYVVARDSLIFVFLVPEAISALVHIFGLHYASKSLRSA
jgi:hypothetical protein